jgi:hypothetical protein
MTTPTCKVTVWSKDSWGRSSCGKAARYDYVNGVPTRCGIHCAEAEAKRAAKSEAKMQAWRDERATAHAVDEARLDVEKALREIAAGHNDPRSLATATIARLDAALERMKP